MHTSLVAALKIVHPYLPGEFFDEARLAALDQWGRMAPPVAWAGFECPLGAAHRWVDFHQGFRREDLPHFRPWLQQRAHTAGSDSTWTAPLLKFCDEWAREDSILARWVPDLILEYDVRDHPDRISPPSIFVALEREDQPSEAALSAKMAVIEAALSLFMEPARVRILLTGIARCVRAAPRNASVTHLGLMLARAGAAARINIRGLHFDQFAPLLRAVEWNASTTELDGLLAGLCAFVERINLCLDVGEQVAGPIGLECTTYLRDNARRWGVILASLAARSICTDEQKDSLQKWWGRDTPVSVKEAWPSNLMVAELLSARDQLGVIDRYISHFKVTWQPGVDAKFKAYLGFMHRFLTRSDGPEPTPAALRARRLPCPVRAAHDEHDIDGAISAAIEFLRWNRWPSGLWQDFPGTGVDDPWQMFFGASDEWVSAYVAAALGALDSQDARDAAKWVWRLLTHRRREGMGWGYSCISPTDADSTVWGLRLAQVVGASSSSHARNACDFIRRHHQSSGGIGTYLPDAAIRDFSALKPSMVNAWCEPHVCVTAAAANLPELRSDCLRFLRDTQKDDGRWVSYWWMDSEYSTGLAASALAQSDDTDDRSRIERAVRWAIDRVSAAGGVMSAGCNAEKPFATACNLRTLLSATHVDRTLVARSIGWLLREQQPDGSWEGSAIMRTPPVNVLDPDASDESILAQDRNSNFTTATVLTSLGLARAGR